MERSILKFSYWTGIVLGLMSLCWRAANYFGILASNYSSERGFDAMTFLKGAVLFLLIAVATSHYASSKSRQS